MERLYCFCKIRSKKFIKVIKIYFKFKKHAKTLLVTDEWKSFKTGDINLAVLCLEKVIEKTIIKYQNLFRFLPMDSGVQDLGVM